MRVERCRASDIAELTAFLRAVDLTVTGLEAPTARLWIERDETHTIVGSTGYELSVDGAHALVRSVAVGPTQRSRGRGSALAVHALNRAAGEGATRAWLFSRRSGPFWQRLGFVSADREQLATALAHTHQVQSFRATGQLAREVAWSRPLSAPMSRYDEPRSDDPR